MDAQGALKLSMTKTTLKATSLASKAPSNLIVLGLATIGFLRFVI
jgi:hypothetical protein